MYFDEFSELEREFNRKERSKEIKEKVIKKKRRNKSYLKGRRGVRLYYDYDKRYDYENDEDVDEDEQDEYGYDAYKDKKRQVKCVFKKDLRIRKLFAYLKYLNGKKILVRDLAWHFAVTERTIQHDLRWLENNGFITTQKNKTRKGIQTKNSYLVNADKEKDLPFENTYLAVCFIAKQGDDYYVLTKTNYVPQEQNFKKFKTMKDCNFNLPQVKLSVEKRLDDKSLNMAKKLFENDLSKYYKGYIYSGYYNKKILHHSDIDYDDIIITNCRTRLMFSWFLLDDLTTIPTGYMWIKLDSSNRKIDNTITNKCLNKIQAILGVK